MTHFVGKWQALPRRVNRGTNQEYFYKQCGMPKTHQSTSKTNFYDLVKPSFSKFVWSPYWLSFNPNCIAYHFTLMNCYFDCLLSNWFTWFKSSSHSDQNDSSWALIGQLDWKILKKWSKSRLYVIKNS